MSNCHTLLFIALQGLHTSQSSSQVCFPESWITKCGSKLIYETLLGKAVVYVLPITSILRRLPAVWAGDTGTIPFGYSNGCCKCAHSYNHGPGSTTSLTLIQAEGLETAALCTLWIPGRWDIKWILGIWVIALMAITSCRWWSHLGRQGAWLTILDACSVVTYYCVLMHITTYLRVPA